MSYYRKVYIFSQKCFFEKNVVLGYHIQYIYIFLNAEHFCCNKKIYPKNVSNFHQFENAPRRSCALYRTISCNIFVELFMAGGHGTGTSRPWQADSSRSLCFLSKQLSDASFSVVTHSWAWACIAYLPISSTNNTLLITWFSINFYLDTISINTEKYLYFLLIFCIFIMGRWRCSW